MPAAHIRQHILNQVSAARLHFPQMMMRIDDRQIGFQRDLGFAGPQPGFQVDIAARGRASELAFAEHDFLRTLVI